MQTAVGTTGGTRLAHELNEADEESQYYTFRGCVQVLHAIFRLFERTFLTNID